MSVHRGHNGHHDHHHQKSDTVTVESVSVPEIPRPLTSTFTTNFDLRKGSAHNASTTFGLSRERRASMEGMERPKLDTSPRVSAFNDEMQSDHEDDDNSTIRGSQTKEHSTLDDVWSAPLAFKMAMGSTVANCVIAVVGIYIAYKASNARGLSS